MNTTLNNTDNQIDEMLHFITSVTEELKIMNLKLDQIINKNRYLTIPQAAEKYNIHTTTLSRLCKTDSITGCYFIMNPNAKTKRFYIDTVKMDEYLQAGGAISTIIKKYQHKM